MKSRNTISPSFSLKLQGTIVHHYTMVEATYTYSLVPKSGSLGTTVPPT